jgi:isopenicillin N synthase-like dioxygenase
MRWAICGPVRKRGLVEGSSMALAIVDLAQEATAGAAIDHGFATHGFLQFANFAVDGRLLAAVFRESQAFFALPEVEKRRFAYRSASENFGYQGLREENLDPAAAPDLKETFTMRNLVHRPMPQDRWPSSGFREVMTGFFAQALSAAQAVQRVMARQLGEAEDFFVRLHSGENVTLRLLHYPACPAGDQIGAGAHTDYGFMTLVFQDGAGGLQVLGQDTRWLDVAPGEGLAVVNSGDLLERWTNGRYRSTLHRVIPPTHGERFSIALFIDPDSHALVEALPACVSPDNPARHGPITAGENLQTKLEASHKGRFEA